MTVKRDTAKVTKDKGDEKRHLDIRRPPDVAHFSSKRRRPIALQNRLFLADTRSLLLPQAP